MKKLALLLSLIMLSGCCSIPPQALEQIGSNAIISDAFIILIEKGDTTRDQEQAFIHANRRNWHALNFAINEAPLPEDIQEDGARDSNLLESLEKDPKIRAMVSRVKAVLVPDVPTPESPDGN
jgi:hypothetical protein